MVNSNHTKLTPNVQRGNDSPRYVDLCEVCGGFRPHLVMTPEGPVMLCRRCAYKLGYSVKGAGDGKY